MPKKIKHIKKKNLSVGFKKLNPTIILYYMMTVKNRNVISFMKLQKMFFIVKFWTKTI